ncbi:MAG: type II secretion system major pseudopilin GspG [Hyphomonadaceae bacterium]|nr:type II secretion system major pseudopilin GspG [Hyphomonadaceae bacterium]
MLQRALRRRRSGQRLHREAGVTLVEMMVVIVIIGLVTAIVVINVLPAQDTARIEKARADIRLIEQALELYRLDYARYPSMDLGLQALVEPPQEGAQAAVQRESYIRRLPNDPWGRPYEYVIPGEHGPFDVYTLGADAQEGGDGVDGDIGNWQ